jgi:6-phosphogluconolactonase
MQSLKADIYDVYLGTYTNNSSSKGIYHAKFDSSNGKLSKPELAAEVCNPSFLAIHPDGKHLYAVTEKKPGEVSAYIINRENGSLKLLNRVLAGGDISCHLSFSKDGRTLFVANYGSGSVSSIPIKADGSLEVPASIIHQKGDRPRAHSVNIDSKNRFIYVAYLGIDKVITYRFNPENSKLTENNQPSFGLEAKSGPRHFTFNQAGKYAYVINEIGNTVTAMQCDPETGVLTEIQTISTLPNDFKDKSYTAELKIHQNGKFLYGSNRGHNSIAVYKIDPETGKLDIVGFQDKGIDTPRHFTIDPSGKYCLVGNQNSDSIAIFAIDGKTGMLKPLEQQVSIGKPVCIMFLNK